MCVKDVSISPQGCCQNCELIPLPDGLLDELRARQLERYAELEKNYPSE